MPGPRKGFGGGRGRGRRFRGGRPRVNPVVSRVWEGESGETPLELSYIELEALRLVDEENLTQEQAAAQMQISRGSLWRILQQARKKVIAALSSGKTHIKLDIQVQDEDTSS
ncbi:MAG: DUF134 domain-containing protein [Candidatus Hodarchaeales archaeon]